MIVLLKALALRSILAYDWSGVMGVFRLSDIPEDMCIYHSRRSRGCAEEKNALSSGPSLLK